MEIIRIRYQPSPLIRYTRSIEKRVPNRWYEASCEDLLAIAGYLSGRLNNAQFAADFIGIPKRISKHLSEFELWSIIQRINLVEKRDPIDHFLIRSIKADNLVLHAPRKLLQDVSFGDFIFFDNYYSDFAYGDKKGLDRMIAWLYPCQKEKSKELIIEKLSYADYATKFAIYINYCLIREWLAARYTYVFVDTKSKKTKKDEKKRSNWLPILDGLIADDLANSDKYEQLPVHTVLRNLNNKIKEGYKRGKLH